MPEASATAGPGRLDGIGGKTALVTGAGRGIGAAIAHALAQQGALVAVADADAQAAQACADEIIAAGGRALPWALDIGRPETVGVLQQLIKALPSRRIDLLVNNAGISPKVDGSRLPVWELDPFEWERVISVNLGGQFYVCRAVLPGMIQAGAGAIVNIGSLAGLRYSTIAGLPYAVSKSGVVGLTRQMAGEVAGHGIRVNAIAPGRIQTAMSAMAAEGINDAVLAGTPLKRLGLPADIASAALFLLSDHAGFITGETLAVTGGRGL